MSADEILTEITIPKTSPQLVGEYIKFSPRDMMDLAYIGVAVAYNFGGDKKCTGVRIVLGAVAPTPIRAKNSEALLEGQVLSEELAVKVGDEVTVKGSHARDASKNEGAAREMITKDGRTFIVGPAGNEAPGTSAY